ncbi:MAG: hypothetical protein NT076_04390 [Candidatus Pacearchaeota archaeon]|nr:hypothetical protein [Candidatus Pacearchaeota archaeon]
MKSKKSQIRLLSLIILISILLVLVAYAAIYTITNLSTSATLNNVKCEAGGQYCHLSVNDSSLIVYLPFDVKNNSAIEYNWGLDGIDYTWNSSSLQNMTGKYGGSYQGNGATSYMARKSTAAINPAKITVSTWVKPFSAGVEDGIVAQWTTGSTGWMIFRTSTTQLSFYINGAHWAFNCGTTGVWSMATATYNGSNVYVYCNGAWDGNANAYTTAINGDNTQLKIGTYNSLGGGNNFNGQIDEVMIFNRSLSATEISQIYNEQFPRFYSQGTQDLNVTIASGNNSVNVTLNEFNQASTNLSLRLSHAGGVTSFQNLTQGVTKTFTIDSTTNLGLNFTYLADSYSFWSPVLNNSIALETYYTSTVYPVFSSYEDNNGTLVSLGTALFNVTIANTNATVLLQINNQNYTARNTTAADKFNVSVSMSSSGNYAYQWISWGNDTNKNFNISTTRYYTVSPDTTPPQIIITSPTNSTNFSYTNAGVNYTASDNIGLSSCWYSNSSGQYNRTIACGTNITGSWDEGLNTITVYANDTSNNINSSSVTFRIDTTSPSITISYPQNITYNVNVSALNYSILDSGVGAQACRYSTNAGGTNTSVTCGTNITGMTSSEGANTWMIETNDSMGNSNSTTISFFKDTIFPLISIAYPSNNSNQSSNSININYTASDTNIQSCFWTRNSGITNTSLACGANISGQTWNQGLNNITIYVNDTSGNHNFSSITFFVDSVLPLIEYFSPTPSNNSYYNTDSLTISITYTEINLKNITFFLYNNTGTLTLVNSTTQSSTLINFTGLRDAVYYYNVSIHDTLENSNKTEIRTFTIDTTKPLMQFESPTPDNNTGRTGSFILNVSIIEVNLANMSYNWNGTIAVYNITNSSLTSINSTLWNLVINQSGMVAGNTYTYNLTAKDLASNSNSTETRLIRGNAAPSFNSISYRPNSTIELDPGIKITVLANMSDSENNFDTAILQWRNSSSTFGINNITMNNLTSISSSFIMNSSFLLPSYEDNITFRILANDTLEETGASANFTLASYWDCTWIYSTDISATSGWNINKGIGNITINNTGDIQFASSNCLLDFRLTYDLAEGRVYFDNDYVKPSNTYTISAGNNRIILVNATFATETKQENLNITISEFRARSNYSSSNISTILVTNQQGPYLYEKFSSYPTSVYLTAGNFNLVGYVRNLMGSSEININNTAYNISFYLVLPDGITNSSGAYSVNYTNITDNSLNYLNTNLTFSDLKTMTSGIKTFKLKASGQNISGDLITDAYNKTYLEESVSITFLCYNVSDSVIVSSCGSLDGDYIAPTTTIASSASASGGGGGGGSISASEKIGEVYELIRGEEQGFKFQVKNKYNSTMRNIKISVSGINSEYIKLNPDKISSLAPYQSQDIDVTITTPKYFTSRKYSLKFDIEASLVVENLDNSYREQKTITLLVVDFTSKEAEKMLNSSQAWLKEMNLSGMSTQKVQELLDSINKQYQAYDFVALKESYTTLKNLHDSAIESKNIISEIESLVIEAEKSGISVTETKRLLYLAKSAFERGDYLSSLEKIKESQLSYALETKGEFNTLYYVKNHPLQSSAFVIIFVIVSYSSFLLVKLRLYKRKLILLDSEEKLLIGLMKVIQKECFEEARMSMEEYEEAMIQYEARLNKIIQEKINTETKLAYLFKIKGRGNALFTERTRLIELIKETQKDYMERGKLETRIYENMLKGYSSRLSEVEEEIALVEAKKALSNKGFIGEKTSFTKKLVSRIAVFFSNLFKRKPKEIKINKIEIKKQPVIKPIKPSLFSRIKSLFQSKEIQVKQKPAHSIPKSINLSKAKPGLSLKAEKILAEEKAEEFWQELKKKVKKPGFFSSIFKSKPKEIKIRKLSELRQERKLVVSKPEIKPKIREKSRYKPGTKEFWEELKGKVEKPKFSVKKWFKK